ncbi:uncharacterized protein BDZ99DRAFT_568575 [Mytilinidion resinicola]|uniref:VPS37 C-terminal domain-containing protein n=1 Tax=Mytilinidion resinicola TaxID=574789 RepID=A0A6A6YZH3_9PEZI|nr:uncharacterized protein BDZ99DRAFT_568575 [Mytilinidion resinicola]KAF2813357.1 hypothetical protein BDZ99DRAFT_568575 [Mytilinidion resinicola]
MSYHSPRQSQTQFQFNPSPPPPPPPKPSAHSSGQATSQPPLPPLPPGQQYYDQQQPPQQYPQGHSQQDANEQNGVPLPEDGWLPDIIKDKTTVDLHHILQNPDLQHAILHNPQTTHPLLPASTAPLQSLLSANLALADSLKALESHLQHQRQSTQSRLLSLRALERQWQAKQGEQDAALREFSPPALYQRLSAAVGEQEALCRGLEESFLDGEAGSGALASEREVAEFVRRLKESRKVAYLRTERKERWDAGRVGGWR